MEVSEEGAHRHRNTKQKFSCAGKCTRDFRKSRTSNLNFPTHKPPNLVHPLNLPSRTSARAWKPNSASTPPCPTCILRLAGIAQKRLWRALGLQSVWIVAAAALVILPDTSSSNTFAPSTPHVAAHECCRRSSCTSPEPPRSSKSSRYLPTRGGPCHLG